MNDITYVGLDVHKARFAWRLPRAAAAGRYDRLAFSRTVPMSRSKWWRGLAGIGGVSASATKPALAAMAFIVC